MQDEALPETEGPFYLKGFIPGIPRDSKKKAHRKGEPEFTNM
jgi:hypothetical protein